MMHITYIYERIVQPRDYRVKHYLFAKTSAHAQDRKATDGGRETTTGTQTPHRITGETAERRRRRRRHGNPGVDTTCNSKATR